MTRTVATPTRKGGLSKLQAEASNAAPVGARKIDTSRGATNMAVSSQWCRRPDDQKFLSLADLEEYVLKMAQQSFQDIIDVRDVKVVAESDNPDDLRLILPTRHRDSGEVSVSPTHWSFGQMCALLRAPAPYLRTLPAQISGINVQWALSNFREENIKTYVRQNGGTELRAATGPGYGRIYDHEIVAAVRRIAGNGTGDTQWKVPGLLDWSTMMYDPNSAITKQTTTLFASDRDVFIFLCDDTHPIEIGKLPDGSPDLIFRGFIVYNSEVGHKKLTVITFYMRGSCCNRIMWGVEGYEEISLRHSKNAPIRFAGEIRPALESFSNAAPSKLLTGIKAAQAAVVARDDDARQKFLKDQGFTRPESKDIIAAVIREEDKKPKSIWDFVQGITAVARDIPYQDERVAFERRATRLLDKVKV